MLIIFIISRFSLLNSLIFSFKYFRKFTITAPLQIITLFQKLFILADGYHLWGSSQLPSQSMHDGP